MSEIDHTIQYGTAAPFIRQNPALSLIPNAELQKISALLAVARSRLRAIRAITIRYYNDPDVGCLVAPVAYLLLEMHTLQQKLPLATPATKEKTARQIQELILECEL